MTLDEFMLLKAGDKVQGMNGDVGTIDNVIDDRRRRSVAVLWGGGAAFSYGTNTTAWMHWSVVEHEITPDQVKYLHELADEQRRKVESVAQVSVHDSGCAMFNRPAFPASRCDCSANKSVTSEDDANGERTG